MAGNTFHLYLLIKQLLSQIIDLRDTPNANLSSDHDGMNRGLPRANVEIGRVLDAQNNLGETKKHDKPRKYISD